jgi:hypothetical protein
VENSRKKPSITGPLVVAGGEIDSTSVTLRFFGDDLDPVDVSRMLGAEPTLQRRKGEVIPDPSQRVARTGSWLLSSERQSKSSLESQIEHLFERLTDDMEVWRQLSSKYRGDLFCGLWSESWNRGLELSPAVLQRIAARGLRVGFDIYFVEERDR